MYELVNIFDTFLPQLLTYPNPSDPLNIDAANLMNSNLTEYEKKVRSLVKEHSLPQEKMETEILKNNPNNHKDSTDVSEEDKQKSQPMQVELGCADLDELSHKSDLSSLSETSDICDEQMY